MEENQNTYVISTADWKVLKSAKTAEEAATKALESMLRKKGKSLKLSPVVEVVDLSTLQAQEMTDDFTTLLYCPKVMADAGHHDTAREFSRIIQQINENE